MGKRTILDIDVADFEKRRVPNKHYVYIIHVTWSDGSVNTVYRRYSLFFDLQMKLLELFPIEAGEVNPTERCLPFLPGKKLIGRSQVRQVALKRLKPINDYCRDLVKLPIKISESSEVLRFFWPTPEDINPYSNENNKEDPKKIQQPKKDAEQISEPLVLEQYLVVADYKKQRKTEVSLAEGTVVEVVEKNENGWWFISAEDEQGWAPGTYLEKLEGGVEESLQKLAPGQEEKYITKKPYSAQLKDEISFQEGVVVDVIQKSLDGWWLVRYQAMEGWAPGAYLQKVPYQGEVPAPRFPTEVIGKPTEVSNLLGKTEVKSEVTVSPNQLFPPQQLLFNGGSSPRVPPRKESIRASIGKNSKPPRPIKQPQTGIYYTLSDFKAGNVVEQGLSFKANQKVKVIEKAETGWWFVSTDKENKEGWVPSSYLEKRNDGDEATGQQRALSMVAEEREQLPLGLANKKPTEEIVSEAAKRIGAAMAKPVPGRGGAKPTPGPRPPTLTPRADEQGNFSLELNSALKMNRAGNGKGESGRRPSGSSGDSPPIASGDSAAPANQISNARALLKPVGAAGRKAWPPQDGAGSVRKASLPEDSLTPDSKPVASPRKTSLPDDSIREGLAQARLPSGQGARGQGAGGQGAGVPSAPLRSDSSEDYQLYLTLGDYTATNAGEVTFGKDQEVRVYEKDPSGWWLLKTEAGEEGWAPSTFLAEKFEEEENIYENADEWKSSTGFAARQGTDPPQLPPPVAPAPKKGPMPLPRAKRNESKLAKATAPPSAAPAPAPAIVEKRRSQRQPIYVVIANFLSTEQGGLNLVAGKKVKVLDKDPSGWWFIQIDKEKGWAPSNYLEIKS